MTKALGMERHSTFRLWVLDHMDKEKTPVETLEAIKDIGTGLELSEVIFTDEGVADFIKHRSNQTGNFAPQSIANTLGFTDRDNVRRNKAIFSDLENITKCLISRGHFTQRTPKGSTTPKTTHATDSKKVKELEDEVLRLRLQVQSLEKQLSSSAKTDRLANVLVNHGIVYLGQ
ncbi:hypothetical protein MA786_003228 [Vibrio parahaemolyticus]|nr:hypothetical protein [Vibrio parahaemolyticus]EIV8640411.1 hypothetical protein [Vibrio parahaemolyticus]EIY6410623.1 hypothetical protein [Vibrio parahaemolyticus]EJB1764595.1 hypothetical protein [Vibrio parahaemolyticus]